MFVSTKKAENEKGDDAKGTCVRERHVSLVYWPSLWAAFTRSTIRNWVWFGVPVDAVVSRQSSSEWIRVCLSTLLSPRQRRKLAKDIYNRKLEGVLNFRQKKRISIQSNLVIRFLSLKSNLLPVRVSWKIWGGPSFFWLRVEGSGL